MAGHPNNFFVIWTNAPLVAGATNTQEALLSDRFCRWAADTLAKGLDPGFGAFPRNVHVFDFFHVLAAANGMLPAQYASSTSDSHPNSAATALVAPRLVNELFDAALACEQSSASAPGFEQLLERFSLEQNFPNPFNPSTRIAFSLPARSEVDLSVYDLLGNPLVTLANGVMSSGRHEVVMDGTGLATGVYFYRIRTAAGAIVRRCVLIR